MRASATTRTAVYGPVRTVVWQGSAGDRRPYADLIPNADVAAFEIEQALVRDGDAMGIAADVVQHLLGPSEGPFGVHDPLSPPRRRKEGGEGLPIRQRRERRPESKLARIKRVLQ